jgi:hypothetical protein
MMTSEFWSMGGGTSRDSGVTGDRHSGQCGLSSIALPSLP